MIALLLLACHKDEPAPEPAPVELADLSWRLHEEMGSLVYASWTQSGPAQVHVEYAFDEGEWLSSPSRELEAGPQEQLLVGIPFDTSARWKVVVEGEGPVASGDRITTGPLPTVPLPDVTVSDPSAWAPEHKWLLTSINQKSGGWTGGDDWTFIMDRKGRMVWAQRAPRQHWTLFAQVSVTGDHLLWDQATYWANFDEGHDSKVHRTYLDEPIDTIPTPGLHHAFVELPDGTLLWGSQAHGGGEALVQKAPGENREEVLWTCAEDWPGAGNCESNGIYYDPATDRVLYSFYTNNSIVEVDRATGESVWWAGMVTGGYTFDPPESQFLWQHGISWTDTGTLLVSSEHEGPDGWGTWLLEYEVDHTNGVLREVWSNDSGVYAETNGQAWRLPNGHTLHIVGAASVIREVDADGAAVWEVVWGDTQLLGQGQFIADLYALVSPE